MAEHIDIDILAHDKTSSVISGIFQGIGQSLANFALRVPGMLMDFGGAIMAEANEAELGLADLRATLISTGGAAGMTEKELVALADGLSKTTRYSDDAVLAGQNMLLTFTNIGKEVFPEATNALVDLATKMKSDLPNAAIQLGKALNDPIQGVTALRRVGVQFTDSQEAMIKSLVETGDLMGAQKLILEELNKEFGGQAAAAGKTFAGQMDILNNRLNNVKETIGIALIPVLTELMDKIIMPLVPYIEQAAEAFAEWITNLDVEAIANFAAVLYDNFIPIWDMIISGATGASQWINDNLMPVFIALGAWWEENSPAIIEAAQRIWTTLSDGVSRIWNDILRPFIEENLPKLTAWWTENVPLIIEVISKLIKQFQEQLPVVVGIIGAFLPVLTGLIEIILKLGTVVLQVMTGDWAGAWESAKSIADLAVLAIGETIYNLGGVLAEVLGFKKNNIIETWTKNWDQLVEIIKKRGGVINDVIESVNLSIDLLSETFDNLTEGMGLSIDLLSSLFGINPSGQRAQGGMVAAGQSYLVGEQGAEMFVPNTSGNIIPNGATGGAINITLNYSPAVTLGNRQEAESTLLPYILSGIRAAQANGLLATV